MSLTRCVGKWKKVAQHLAKGGLDAEAVASVFLHLQGSCVCFLHEAAINLGVACVSAGGHVPRHPLYALPLRRGISQLRYASVYGLRHPAQLVGVGLAFLAKAPVREPLVEGLGVYSVSYKIMAGVYHLGTTMSSGHYRAFLSEALSEGGSVNPGEPRCVLERAVITDDDHAPTRIAEADFNTVLTNAYLIWLVKD